MNNEVRERTSAFISVLTSSDYPQKSTYESPNRGPVKLIITEQPQEYIRFRYLSEMERRGGSHGFLCARNSQPMRKIYPTVELLNYDQKAVIRVRLINTSNYLDHPHMLAEERYGMDIYQTVPNMKDYVAEFSYLRIINTEKREIGNILREKMKILLDRAKMSYSEDELDMILSREDFKNIGHNNVRLMFSAHDPDTDKLICKPVVSEDIYNEKSAMTNNLKIVKTSIACGKALGHDEIILLVEKIQKDNINVRFIEENVDGDMIWCDLANFHQTDVHHQYAIVCRTPKYRDPDITQNVKVYIELLRPSDNKTSNRVQFTYIASKIRDLSYASFGSYLSSAISERDIPEPALMATRRELNNDFSTDDYFTSVQNKLQEVQTENILAEALQDEAMKSDFNLDEMMSMDENPLLGEHTMSYPARQNNTSLPEVELGSGDSNFPYPSSLTLPSSTILSVEDRLLIPNADFSDYFEDMPDMKHEFERQINCGLIPDSGVNNKTTPCNNDIRESGSKVIKQSDSYTAKYIDNEEVFIKKLIEQFCNLANEENADHEKLRMMLQTLMSKRLTNGDTFLHMAIATKKESSVEVLAHYLIRYKLDNLLCLRNNEYQTLLHYAVMYNTENVFKYLMHDGYLLSLVDGSGNNPLHYAVICNNCVSELLNAIDQYNIKFDINSGDNDGLSPLHLACILGSPTNISELLKHGAKWNKKDKSGRTALHLAAQDHDLSVMRALLDYVHRSDIDEIDDRGYTALQVLCGGELKDNTLDIAKMLLEKGASPTIKHDENQSALELCTNKEELCGLLQKYVDNVDMKVECDVKSEVDEYETAEEEEEDFQDNCLEGYSAYGKPVAEILDKSGKWRQLAVRLGMQPLENLFEEAPSPTIMLLEHIKVVDPSITSTSLAKILFEMEEKTAGQLILDFVDV